MTISSQQLAAALYEAITKHPESSERITNEFLDFCIQKNLQALLPRVIDRLVQAGREAEKVQTVEITSAHELTEEAINSIKKFVDAPADAESTVSVQPQLVGGFVAHYQNVVYDASVNSQLEKAHSVLIK